jgi:hypothetical protein
MGFSLNHRALSASVIRSTDGKRVKLTLGTYALAPCIHGMRSSQRELLNYLSLSGTVVASETEEEIFRMLGMVIPSSSLRLYNHPNAWLDVAVRTFLSSMLIPTPLFYPQGYPGRNHMSASAILLEVRYRSVCHGTALYESARASWEIEHSSPLSVHYYFHGHRLRSHWPQ